MFSTLAAKSPGVVRIILGMAAVCELHCLSSSSDRPLELRIDGLVTDSAQQPQPNDSGTVCVIANYRNLSDSWNATRCNDVVTDMAGKFKTMFTLATKDLSAVSDSYVAFAAACSHAATWPADLQRTYDENYGVDRAMVQATYVPGSAMCYPLRFASTP